ncbi:MAG: hypothetical protein EZS28_022193 [Streblomastix strix]|uniref:Uncharacterized protein n=1 Tax=Streblomastix strix TaxID=222440 RepID=A0A5J4VIF2_9EUKA|nr:MAG: hypothetical protein EZS28_022193 [Streblomastix strix]
MHAKRVSKVAPVQKAKPKTRVSQFIESKKPYIHKDELKLSEAVKKLGPGSSKQRKEIIDKVRQYDSDITHGDVEAAFEGMKGGTRRQRHFDGIDPNDLIKYYKELDKHIRGVHDPLQGVYREAAMSDQSLGINARANELANDIASHALLQPSSRATSPPKGIHKEDDLMNFILKTANKFRIRVATILDRNKC